MAEMIKVERGHVVLTPASDFQLMFVFKGEGGINAEIIEKKSAFQTEAGPRGCSLTELKPGSIASGHTGGFSIFKHYRTLFSNSNFMFSEPRCRMSTQLLLCDITKMQILKR